MKRTLSMLLLAAAVAAPVLSQAQSNGPVSRQHLKQELAQLRAAGYTGDTDASYPNRLVAAEQRVATDPASGYGPQTSGTAMSGVPAHTQARAGKSNPRLQP
jgi:Tfp pilus assembly protein PilW